MTIFRERPPSDHPGFSKDFRQMLAIAKTEGGKQQPYFVITAGDEGLACLAKADAIQAKDMLRARCGDCSSEIHPASR